MEKMALAEYCSLTGISLGNHKVRCLQSPGRSHTCVKQLAVSQDQCGPWENTTQTRPPQAATATITIVQHGQIPGMFKRSQMSL